MIILYTFEVRLWNWNPLKGPVLVFNNSYPLYFRWRNISMRSQVFQDLFHSEALMPCSISLAPGNSMQQLQNLLQWSDMWSPVQGWISKIKFNIERGNKACCTLLLGSCFLGKVNNSPDQLCFEKSNVSFWLSSQTPTQTLIYACARWRCYALLNEKLFTFSYGSGCLIPDLIVTQLALMWQYIRYLEGIRVQPDISKFIIPETGLYVIFNPWQNDFIFALSKG